MKSVKFKHLKIQNFLSIGDNPVELTFGEGINIITGINKDKPDRRNAIGKSTIADGLYFAIFGETLREIKKDLIVNNVTGGTTAVELTFIVESSIGVNEFRVVRCLNPSKVYIYKDGVDKTRDTIANTNKYICDVLSATPSVFQNCVILTVNNAVPFMAKNKIEKRKFIEDIFGLEVFSNMLSELRGELNTVSKEYELENAKYDEVKKTVFDYERQRERVLEQRRSKRETYIFRQQENEDNLHKLETKRDSMVFFDETIVTENIQKLSAGIDKCDSVISEKNLHIGELTGKIKSLKSNLDKIGTDEDVCPVCLRSIEEHDESYIESEKARINNEINELLLSLKNTKEEVVSIQSKKDSISKKLKEEESKLSRNKLLYQEEKNIEDKIKQITKWQESLIEDITQVENTSTEFDNLIETTKARTEELDKLISQKKATVQMLEVVKYVISEEGVKSYIVNKLLELLNSKLIYYLKKLDSNAICYFNEFFEEEIVNEKNKICSYFNFSGAERKSVDLACLFTFSDLRRMQGGVKYNIAFYDELFDSSFDEKGIELIIDILKERAEQYNECIYVISHRSESLKAVTGEVVYLQKENGITNRVDFIDV
jgi:DNA repair exonuclease SbcCD ATPase subunit